MGRQLMLRREMMAKIAPRQKVQKYIELKNTAIWGQPYSGTLDCAALGLEIGDEITVIAIGSGVSAYNTYHDMKGGGSGSNSGGGGGGGDAGDGYGGGYGGDGGSGGTAGANGFAGTNGGNAGEAIVKTVTIEELNIPYTLGGRIAVGGALSDTTFGENGKYVTARSSVIKGGTSHYGGEGGLKYLKTKGGGGGGGGKGWNGKYIDYENKTIISIPDSGVVNGADGTSAGSGAHGHGGKGAANNAGGAQNAGGTDGKAGDKESKSIIVVFYMGYE